MSSLLLIALQYNIGTYLINMLTTPTSYKIQNGVGFNIIVWFWKSRVVITYCFFLTVSPYLNDGDRK